MDTIMSTKQAEQGIQTENQKETSAPPEGSWAQTIHESVTAASGAIHRAVNAVAGYPPEAGKDMTDDLEDTRGTKTLGVHGVPPSTTSSAADPSSGTTPTPSTTKKDDSTSKPADAQPGQTASPTLTDGPSHISTERSDPAPSGPATGGSDSTQDKSNDPSSKLPPPQTSGPKSSTERGDAPNTDEDSSASGQRQVNKGESVGKTDEASSKFKGTQESGPVSMSGQETSHPGSGSTPAGGAAPTGDPSSGQSSKPEDKGQGGANPLKQPEKSEEDKKDPGTGQQYVKSSGVAAEGGDFDAKNPGAGVR